MFQNSNTDKITIATKNNTLIKFLSVNAYQVSESSTRSLIIEGWNSSSKLYSKSFTGIKSWQTLNLNFDNINKIIIRLSTSTSSELTDYNFDNFSFQSNSNTLSLTSPSNGSTGVLTNPTLMWSNLTGANSYRLQVSSSSSFSTNVYDKSSIASNSIQVSGLATSTKYYWRVNASTSSGTSNWTSVYSFTTQSSIPPPTPSANYQKIAAENGARANYANLKVKTGSLGSKVIYCPTTSSTVKFTVNLNKSGQWYAWGRMFFESQGSPCNSFYIQVDNGAKLIFGNKAEYDNWHWEGNTSNPLSLGNLSAGTHTITIYGREARETVMLDQLVVTSDANLVPNDNMESSGGGSGSGGKGGLTFSAENAQLSNYAALKTKSGSIGSKAAYCPTTSSQIKFSVNIPQSGSYYAWGRMFFESAGSPCNSFYLQVDNGSKLTFGNSAMYDQWHWEGNTTHPLSLGNISAGNHTITIYGREARPTVMLDQLLLTTDPNLVPNDNGGGSSSGNSSGNLVFAAYKANLSNYATLRTKAGSIGSQVAYCPITSSQIKFTVNLVTSGKYYAWGRMFFESAGSPRNSFYLQVDNGAKLTFGNNNSNYDKWHWEGSGINNLPLGNISAGTHTITIYGREAYKTVMLDQLLLTNDAYFIPTDDNVSFTKPENTAYNNGSAQNEIPESYSLEQNYPNPFNPSTTIKFSIPQDGMVSLKVYNILGAEVASLVDEVKSVGTYNVRFDASNLASGIYLYKLVTPNFIQTKKMLLVK